MKTPLTFAALLLTGSLVAQDPGYKAPEPRRTVQLTSEQAREDTRESVGKINSMDVLDDTRPLKVGDKIVLRIVEDRDKVQSLFVLESGDIQAPHIGLVKAVGKTCKQLAVTMKRDLERQFFQTATVIVALEMGVSRTGSPNFMPLPQTDTFTIFGSVARQGKYEILADEDLTISQAILRAGGFAQFAKKSKVQLIRKYSRGSTVNVYINLEDIMERGKLDKDIPVRPNDVIIVREKQINF